MFDCLMNGKNWTSAWRGELVQNFVVSDLPLFYVYTFAYFIVDVFFIFAYPKCVKSPTTILVHHMISVFMIITVYMVPEYYWYMGALLIVEVNTWLIIARRVIHNSGISKRHYLLYAFISSSYYISWIVIRICIYPYLTFLCYQKWIETSKENGSYVNIIGMVFMMTFSLSSLNVKWTYDMVMGKLRFLRSGSSNAKILKGL